MQQKACSNSERQCAILGSNREWISWEVEQLTIFARRNLQGIPSKKHVRLEIHQDGCQQKYFISQSFAVLWLQFHFFVNLFSTAGTSNKQVWDVLSFLTRFFWNSAVLWYFAFCSKDHKLVTRGHKGFVHTAAVWGEGKDRGGQ